VGDVLGYARVSTGDQDVAGQTMRLEQAGAIRVECFQVSIERPEGTEVLVNAWSIETADDSELHHEWTVPIGDLKSTLEAALNKIGEWKVRPRLPTW